MANNLLDISLKSKLSYSLIGLDYTKNQTDA